MNSQISTRLLELRAKALLTVSLTARDDLAVEEVAADSGYDFVIRIVRDGSLTNRMFAAELKAAVKDVGPPHVPFDTRQLLYYRDIPFPVCLFYFSMADDKGYYRWLVEPTISAGQPGLAFRIDEGVLEADAPQSITFQPAEFEELDPKSLGRLVRSVDDWYDRRASPK